MKNTGEKTIGVFYRSCELGSQYAYLAGLLFVLFGIIGVVSEINNPYGRELSAVLLSFALLSLGILLFILPSIYMKRERLIITNKRLIHIKGGNRREIPLEDIADVVVGGVQFYYVGRTFCTGRIEGTILILGRDGEPLVIFKTYNPENVRSLILSAIRVHTQQYYK